MIIDSILMSQEETVNTFPAYLTRVVWCVQFSAKRQNNKQETFSQRMISYFLASCSDLKSFIMSPVPGTIIIGKFNHGPANSLKSDPSEARELFLDEHLLDVREHRRLILGRT